jgi:hypothetical protein
VEPINPCATNTPKRTPPFRKPKFGGSPTAGSTSHKEKQLEDLVQATLVKYLHHVEEVVFQYSEWQDTIPISGYHSFEEKQ